MLRPVEMIFNMGLRRCCYFKLQDVVHVNEGCTNDDTFLIKLTSVWDFESGFNCVCVHM